MPFRLKDLMSAPQPLAPHTAAAEAAALFAADPLLEGLAVAKGGAPVGVATRAAVFEAVRPGAAGKPISTVMATAPLLAPPSQTAALAAKRLSAGGASALACGVVVVEDGLYRGLVAPSALLDAVALENVQRARSMADAAKRREAETHAAQEQAAMLDALGREMRDPLTGVLGFADLLSGAGLNRESRKWAETIALSGRAIDRLVRDVATLSMIRADALALNMSPFRPRDLARDAERAWAETTISGAPALRVGAALGGNERLVGDVARLRQLILCFADALAPGAGRGGVQVSLEAPGAPGPGFLIRASVSGGPGREALQRFAAESEAGRSGDLRDAAGMGFAVARALVRRMGGQLTFDAAGGAICASAPVRKAGPQLAVDNAPARRTANFQLGDVLVADGHGVSREVVVFALREAGWRVDAVATRAQAERRAAGKAYQAVLVEYGLAGYDSPEAGRPFKPVGDSAGAKVLALCAQPTLKAQRAAQAAGCAGLLEKPVKPRDLVAAVADALLDVQSAESLRRA